MTHRNNDLLSIFDANRQAERKARTRTEARDAVARGAPKERRAGGGFAGLWLTPRHVVVASCAITLLVVLAFFVGLAAGKPGASGAGVALRKDQGGIPAKGVLLRLRVDSMDMATGRPVAAADVRARLGELGLDARYLRTVSKERGQWVVDAGPFRSAEELDRWIEQHRLGGARVCGSVPFQQREIVRLDAR